MLDGVLTGRMPSPPGKSEGEAVGLASYSAVLTPKGRMVSDLMVFSVGDSEERMLLDVPRAGGTPLVGHLRRYVPPRLASVEDISTASAAIRTVGPRAAAATTAVLSSLASDAHWLGDVTQVLSEGSSPAYVLWRPPSAGWMLVARALDLRDPAFDLLGDVGTLSACWSDLVAAGVMPAGEGVFETLRVESGTPAFGVDMTEETLPPEAGIQDRAIDHEKGCYTGQEVIVRIRDRGHVNRHLRGLVFGDLPTPRAGAQLFQHGEAKPIGTVTSAATSPRFGASVGLGYVRREIAPGTTVRLDGPDGAPVEVRDLQTGWGHDRGLAGSGPESTTQERRHGP